LATPAKIIGPVNDLGHVQVANFRSERDFATGRIPGSIPFHRFGYNPTVPNGSFADVWSYGPSDATYNWLTAADTLRVQAGGNVNDTAGGSGAGAVQIVYLDESWMLKTQTISTAGAGASGVTGKAWRFIRASVENVGTYTGNNTGNIIIETSAGTIVGYIQAGIGQTEMTMLTVPANHTGYLIHVDIAISTGTNKDADIRIWQRPRADIVSAPFGPKRLVGRAGGVTQEYEREYHSFPSFGPKTDIWVEAQGNGATTSVSVDYDMELVEDV